MEMQEWRVTALLKRKARRHRVSIEGNEAAHALAIEAADWKRRRRRLNAQTPTTPKGNALDALCQAGEAFRADHPDKPNPYQLALAEKRALLEFADLHRSTRDAANGQCKKALYNLYRRRMLEAGQLCLFAFETIVLENRPTAGLIGDLRLAANAILAVQSATRSLQTDMTKGAL